MIGVDIVAPVQWRVIVRGGTWLASLEVGGRSTIWTNSFRCLGSIRSEPRSQYCSRGVPYNRLVNILERGQKLADFTVVTRCAVLGFSIVRFYGAI